MRRGRRSWSARATSGGSFRRRRIERGGRAGPRATNVIKMVERRRLDNGLRIAVAPIAELRTTAVLLAVEAGQWFEPLDRAGVARLTAQTMLRGTTKRDANAWADAIDALGAVARLDVGAHAAVFSAQCLGDDLGGLLELMAEALCTPALHAEDLEFVRAQTLAQLERDERDTRAVVDRVWRELVYPRTHPFHSPSIGDARAIHEASVDDIRDYHASAIRPDGALLAVAGATTVDEVERAATQALGAWHASRAREARA